MPAILGLEVVAAAVDSHLREGTPLGRCVYAEGASDTGLKELRRVCAQHRAEYDE